MPFSNKATTNCKSKGSQSCTPINLHVCIMQLVWIPSMCRTGCQVVCLLTHVCSCIHTPTVSKRLSAVACGKEWLLCWKSVCARTPSPRPPTGGARERWGLLSIASELTLLRRNAQGRATWGHQFRDVNRLTECLLLSSFNLYAFKCILSEAVRVRRCVPVCMCWAHAIIFKSYLA